MKKTKWGQTILEGSDIADLPLVSENAEIVEEKVESELKQVKDDITLTKNSIPKEVSKLKNDAGYITSAEVDLSAVTSDIENLKVMKADKTYVNSKIDEKIQVKADKAYVDNKLNTKLDTSKYNTDKSSIDSQLSEHDKRINTKANKTELDKVFQSGVESNKILVDALNSKEVQASTDDTIKVNVNKVNDIKQGAQIPLKPVTNLRGVGTGRESVRLTWKSPADIVFEGETITEFKEDVLVRNDTRAPQNLNDGKIIVTASRDEFMSNAFVDTDVNYDNKYYYRVFSVSKNGLITSGNSVSVDVTKGTPIKDLPVGAKIKSVDSKYYGKPIVWMKLEDNHYGMNETTLLSEKIISLKASDAKEPSNPNSDRKNDGNNRYIHSNIKQWLNSSASSWYSSKHSYDAPPIKDNLWGGHNPYDSEKGFMANLTPELRAAILPTSLQVLKNDKDGGGLESFTDKIFLLSCTEVGLDNGTSHNEGTKFDYFKSSLDRVAYPTKEAIDNSTFTSDSLATNKGWHWYLRTPISSSSSPEYVRYVHSGGSGSHNSARLGYGGVRPALNLDSSTTVPQEPDSDGVYILSL